MFFILSKILLALICPITWIFILIVLALITKSARRRRRALIATAIIFFAFSNPFLLTRFARAWDIDTHTTTNRKYSCAILLGGFSSYDTNGQGFFNASADRFIQAVKLHATGQVFKVLISGGSAALIKNQLKEADYVRGQLKIFNLPDSSILTENQSRNTLENAKFSKAILQNKHIAPPYLLITSAFHMRRALYTFKKIGFDVVPYPCDYVFGHEEESFSDIFLPSAEVLNKWNLYIKEVIGYIVYHFKS